MEQVDKVTLHYISGRQVELNAMEALAALSQPEFAAGKPTTTLLFDHTNPELKIYKVGQGYRLESPSWGTREFKNKEALNADPFCANVYKEWIGELPV